MVIALLIKNSLLKSLYENLDFNGEFEVKIKIKKENIKLNGIIARILIKSIIYLFLFSSF